MTGEKVITGVKILEEIQMLQIELEYNSCLRRKTDTLLRIVVQELTLEALTLEKTAWLVRPILEGQNDTEERIIRARMKPTMVDFEEAVRQMDKKKYDRVPMGLVGTAKQIMQTAENYRRIYSPVEIKESGSQTDYDGFDSPDDESLFHSMDSSDPVTEYFDEEHQTSSEKEFCP